MNWTDYNFPMWVIPQTREKIMADNPNFETWAKSVYKHGIFAVAEAAGFKTLDDKYVKGKFIYYKDNRGYIIDNNTYVFEIRVEKKKVISPQMLKYSCWLKKSQKRYFKFLNAALELEVNLLQVLKFETITSLLVEIPIGTKTKFEKLAEVKLEDIVKVQIN